MANLSEIKQSTVTTAQSLLSVLSKRDKNLSKKVRALECSIRVLRGVKAYSKTSLLIDECKLNLWKNKLESIKQAIKSIDSSLTLLQTVNCDEKREQLRLAEFLNLLQLSSKLLTH